MLQMKMLYNSIRGYYTFQTSEILYQQQYQRIRHHPFTQYTPVLSFDAQPTTELIQQ